MAERTQSPIPAACTEWQMLLAEALDGLLKPEHQALFADHKSLCPACASLFEESSRGREWLEFLSTKPEVPAGLLDRILSQTGPAPLAGLMPATVPIPQLWQRPSLPPSLRSFVQPRLMMTAAMAFFSIALTLNLSGVHLSATRLAALHTADLRSIPGEARSFLERRLTMASTSVIRYYDHSHLIYEVESTVQELRRATESDDGNQQKPREDLPGETSVNLQRVSPAFRQLHRNASATEPEKRSTAWTA